MGVSLSFLVGDGERTGARDDCFIKSADSGNPVDKCDMRATDQRLLRCGKALRGIRKWPESAVSSASGH
jgi:hypothetical protein